MIADRHTTAMQGTENTPNPAEATTIPADPSDPPRHMEASTAMQERGQNRPNIPADEPHAPYVTNYRNSSFVVLMQESEPTATQTPRTCKAYIVPTPTEESAYTIADEVRRYNDRLCEMLHNDRKRLHRTAPQTREHDTALQMYRQHQEKATETRQGIEAKATATIEGVTAYLMSHAEIRAIAGKKIPAIYDDRGRLVSIADTALLTELYHGYTAPAEADINLEDIEVLRANGMTEEIAQMYHRLYADLLRQENRQAEEADRTPTPFGEALKPYRTKYFEYLQNKIDQHPIPEIKDMTPIIVKDTDKVLRLIGATIAEYYREPTEDGNGKGGKEIGSILGLLEAEGYINPDTPPKELHERFIVSFPQCEQIKWKGVGKYQRDKEAQEDIRTFAYRYLQ